MTTKLILILITAFICSCCYASKADVKFDSFESDGSMFGPAATSIQRVKQYATDGDYSMLVPIKGSEKDTWPGLFLSLKEKADWSAYNAMKMDVYVEGNESVKLTARLDTTAGIAWISPADLQPGWNKNWTIPIAGARDATNIKQVTGMWLGYSCPHKDYTLYFDNVRLGGVDCRKVVHLDDTAGISPNPAEKRSGFQLFSLPYSCFIFPNTKPQNRLSQIWTFAAVGEFEPVTVSILSLRKLDDLSVVISELSGPKGASISQKDWDIRVVRYMDKRENYQVDSYIADTPTYIEKPASPEILETNTTATFWLTLKVPQSAKPGIYRGSVVVSSGSGRQSVPITLRVLPFKLPELKDNLQGIYYNAGGGWLPAKEQVRFDLKDMRDHGMTSIGLSTGIDSSSYKVNGTQVTFDFKDNTTWEYIMDSARDLGFPAPLITICDNGQWADPHEYASGAYAETYINFWKGISEAGTAKGWNPIYIQPEDEVGWRTQADRDRNTYLLGLLNKAGFKTEVDGPSDGYFNTIAGPLSDIWNYCGTLGPNDTVKQAQADGKIVTVYNFDCGGFTPEVQRWARGLFNWKHNLKGSYNWLYRGGNGSIFDDQDAIIGDWVHYYPPRPGHPGGPTMGWEASREGIDDLKYIKLLESLIDTASHKSGKPEKAAKIANAVLLNIKNLITSHPDSTTNRVEWARKLDPEAALKEKLINKLDPEVDWYYTGDLKYSSGIPLQSYDTIRWAVAEQCVNLMSAMGESDPLPSAGAVKSAKVVRRISAVKSNSSNNQEISTRPIAKVPTLSSEPTLDGVVETDPGWKNAKKVSLTLSSGLGKPQQQTEAMFGLFGTNMYVCFICHEDRIDSIVAKEMVDSDNVWQDDCVEVFIDPKRTEKSFYQVVANSRGAIYKKAPDGFDWKSDIKAIGKVEKDNRRWIVEMCISLKDIDLGNRIGLNFCRERRPLNIYELSSWAVTGRTFRIPERFGIGLLSENAENMTSANGVKPEISLDLTPPVSNTSETTIGLTCKLTLPDFDLLDTKINLLISGNGKTIHEQIQPPLANKMPVILDIRDLAAGNYTLKASLTKSGKRLAEWEGMLVRVGER